MKQEKPPLYFWIFMAFTFGLFFYLAGCAFARVEPFSQIRPAIINYFK